MKGGLQWLCNEEEKKFGKKKSALPAIRKQTAVFLDFISARATVPAYQKEIHLIGGGREGENNSSRKRVGGRGGTTTFSKKKFWERYL